MTDEVRLRDVAEAAGVSIATASRALTGRNRVSASTTAHVTAVARRLGYQVNSVGRALREGSTRSVGMTVPVIGNPYFAQLVDAVEGALVAPGLELLIADSHGDVDHEARRLRTLVGRQIDGLVVVPADVERSAPACDRVRRVAAARARREEEKCCQVESAHGSVGPQLQVGWKLPVAEPVATPVCVMRSTMSSTCDGSSSLFAGALAASGIATMMVSCATA